MKLCKKCNCTKHTKEFSSCKTTKDKLQNYCKNCHVFRWRTKKGRIYKIYISQKQSSKKRKHNMPNYSKEELYLWATEQQIYTEIYDKWVQSNYSKDLSPSIDRLDDYKPYTLDNIRITNWEDNRRKAHKDRKEGKNNKINKGVVCINNLNNNDIKEFHSLREASRKSGVSRKTISNYLNKKDSIRGFKWKTKEQYETYLRNR